MQVIDILRDNQQTTLPCRIQPRQCMMSSIGFDLLNPRAAHVVKTQNQIGITGKSLRRRHIFNAVLFPQATCRTECIDPAFRAYASAC